MGTLINKKFLNSIIESQILLDFIDTVFTLIILFVISRILIKVIQRFMKSSKVTGRVLITSINLLKSVINVIFLIMALFTVLDFFGVNTASLLATAGIGGIAVGFGAQSLVKDIISGFFILLEGQYYIGDEVVIEGVSGNVVDFTMRTTKVQDFSTGAIHFIPNGQIKIVENRSREDQIVNVIVDIPNNYDLELVMRVLKDKLESYKDVNIVAGPSVKGVSEFKDRYFSILIITKVRNGKIYEYQRKIRKLVSEALREESIDLYHPIFGREGVK